MKLDELVEHYRKLRDTIADIKEEHKRELEDYNRALGILTLRLLKTLDDTGQLMARTKYGTVSAVVHQTASCADDPDGFIQFVRKNDLWELVNRSANKDACLEYAEKHDGNLPPGVKINSRRDVDVRAPTAKRKLEDA